MFLRIYSAMDLFEFGYQDNIHDKAERPKSFLLIKGTLTPHLVSLLSIMGGSPGDVSEEPMM